LRGESRVALADSRHLGVAEDVVPAALEAQGDRGEVTEHVLTDREEARVGFVVALFAVDDAEAVSGLAAQVVERQAHLLALFLVAARSGDELHVDGSAGDHVHVVVRRRRELLAELLADQHRGAINGDAAAVVPVVEHIRTIFGEHTCNGVEAA
jgi:hypothetical protein